MIKPSRRFIIVGISGGVDSAVSAFLLKKQGYHVEAIFMQNWQENSADDCSVEQDLKDATDVCDVLKIKLHTINFSKEYKDKVFKCFLDEYAAGRTPNPDVLCNKEIKFKAFLDYAKSIGADLIATGHYARKITQDGRELLLKGLDPNKDQSYFLYLLNQEQLKSVVFPLGDLTKDKVRQIAETEGLPNYAKKDSTGICFIGERKFKDFLSEYLLTRPGEIRTLDNVLIGHHDGLMFLTIGQRKGIGIGGQKLFSEAPWYVVDKDLENNILIVTQEKEHPRLMLSGLVCSQIHWISGQTPKLPLKCLAKIRYRQQDQECVITQPDDSENLLVKFTVPQWAVTPGQSVVFYLQDICLGGGIILANQS